MSRFLSHPLRLLFLGPALFVFVLPARTAAAAENQATENQAADSKSAAHSEAEHKETKQGVDYLRQIKPLLQKHCVSCHGPLRRKGGLRLDAAALIRKGGDSGSAIVPGKPEESLLLGVLSGKDGYTRMPLDGKPLKPDEIALIRRWIQQGAPAPQNEPIEADPREHWAFRPPQRPSLPAVKKAGWVRNPIDAFIVAQWQRRGLKPQPAAPKHILLRRVYLDLIGLPPTPAELREFLNDTSPDAYEKVVDRLLESPRYGERWGRHWMDVWRYSDWYGYKAQLRNSARHIWRWRDYIIESLNKDRPYSEMLIDMLAADENTPTNADRLRATGFLARNYYLFNRNVWLDTTIEHTGKAFLGLTLNCARCHEHKYDPIEQAEYYRFRAIFEPHQIRTDPLTGKSNTPRDGLAIAYDAAPDAKTYVFERGNDKRPDKEHPVPPGVPAFLLPAGLTIRPVELPVAGFYPALRPGMVAQNLREAEAAVRAGEAEWQKASTKKARLLARKKQNWKKAALASLRARLAAERTKYGLARGDLAALAKAASRAERAAALAKAEYDVAVAEHDYAAQKAATRPQNKQGRQNKKGQNRLASAKKALSTARQALKRARAAAAKESSAYKPLGPVYPRKSTGRRLALARWIASERNPLTARVAVNHIWMRHFGKPLVPTVFDFGRNGKPPTHPQLLDWLAVEFMQNGWSMKHLHRLMVTSATYRLSSSTSRADEQTTKTDPDNRYLWRMNSRRMEGEILRDSILWLAGRLDRKMGGPELDAKLGETTFRRSIYYRHAPEKFVLFLQIFDGASTHECYRRNETVVPQQSLALINSRLVLEQSRRLAAFLNRQTGTDLQNDAAFVAALFVRVLCRQPTAAETAACLSFLDEQTRRLSRPQQLSPFTGGPKMNVPPAADPHQRARENLVGVMLNHNEFVTIR